MPKAKTQKLSQSSAISQGSNKAKKQTSAKVVAKKKSPAASTNVKKTQKGSKKVQAKPQKNKVPIKGSSKKIQKVEKKGGSKAVIKKNSPAPVFGKSAQKSTKTMQPKRPNTPYQIFSAQMQTQMHSMPKFKELSLGDRAKVVGESWTKLSDDQKKQYVDMANEDKQRYEKELKQVKAKGFFINKDGNKIISTETKKAFEDDVTKPKKAMSAFIFFSNQNRAIVKKQNPDISLVDISKKSGEQWNTLSAKQKEPFEKQHQNDILRYEKESKQLNELGYFTNSDGVKSTYITKKGKVQEFEVGTIMPKKVMSPYMMYMIEFYKNNDTKGGNAAQKMKEISAQWSTFTEKHKQKYELLSQKDGQRYQNQLSDIKKKGYFMTGDGKKSTDLPRKQKRARKSPTKK